MSKKKKKQEVSAPIEATEEKPQADIKEQIKEMERKKRQEVLKKASLAPASQSEQAVSFDEWYMRRAPAIPSSHRKEVLRADFKGRGLGKQASLAKYDEALEKYGVKLKK